MDAVRIQRPGLGRPRSRPGRAMADKAYSSAGNRAYLRQHRIKAVIPVKEDQKAHRRNRGRAGGRPPVFDDGWYKKRNTVERCFSKLSHTYRPLSGPPADPAITPSRRSVVRPGHRRRYAQWPQLLIYDPCRQPPGSPGPRGTVEHPGQGRITVRAPAVAGQTPGAQPVPVALDQQRAALVAAGALALRIVHVAGAGVAQRVIQAMRRARASVAAGVGGRSRILKSGGTR